MSTVLKGDIQINADPSRFVQGVQRAEKSLNTLTAGTQKTGQSLQRLTQSTTQSNQAMQRMGQSAQQAAAGTARMSQSTQQATQATSRFNAGTIATGASIATMGAGLVSMEASFSNYTKAQQKVEKAEQGVQKTRDLLLTTNVSLQRAELKLSKMLEKGTATEAELAAARANVALYTQKRATATQELTVKEQDLNIAMMDQADTHKLMASSIATTVIGTVSMAAQMIQAKAATAGATTSMVANMKANIANSKALKILGIDLNAARANFTNAGTALKGYTINATGARVSVTGFGKATQFASLTVKGLWASLGPIGLLTILATSLYTAWETSQQFRDGVMWLIDGIQDLFEIVKKVIVPLQWLDEGLKAIGINVGESVDEWQDHNAVIGQAEQQMYDMDTAVSQTDAQVQQLTTTVDTETAAIQDSTMATQEFNAQTEALTGAVMTATAAINQKAAAHSADMAMMRASSATIQSEGLTALQSFRESIDAASEGARNHERALADNELKIRIWGNEYKRIMAEEGPQAAAVFKAESESLLQQAADNVTKYGGDTSAVLQQHGIDWLNVKDTVSDVSSNVQSDVTQMGGTVTRTMKSIHQEIAAFQAALKKNDDFVTYTTSDILRAFKTMSKEAQVEYEKIMIADAQARSTLAGMLNTGITDIEGALTEMFARVGLPGHYGPGGANIGANMRNTGPPKRSAEANALLRRGIWTRDPAGDGVWRKSHVASWKSWGRHMLGAAEYVNGRWKVYHAGTHDFDRVVYGSSDPVEIDWKKTKKSISGKIEDAMEIHGNERQTSLYNRIVREISDTLKISIDEAKRITTPDRTYGHDYRDDIWEYVHTQFDWFMLGAKRSGRENDDAYLASWYDRLTDDFKKLDRNRHYKEAWEREQKRFKAEQDARETKAKQDQYVRETAGREDTTAQRYRESYVPPPPPPPPAIAGTPERDEIIRRLKKRGFSSSTPLESYTTEELRARLARTIKLQNGSDQTVRRVFAEIDSIVGTTTTGSSGVFETNYDVPTDRTGTKIITQEMIDYANSQAGQDEYQRHLETLVRKGEWKSEYEGHDVYELRQVIEVNAV